MLMELPLVAPNTVRAPNPAGCAAVGLLYMVAPLKFPPITAAPSMSALVEPFVNTMALKSLRIVAPVKGPAEAALARQPAARMAAVST
jgi:hypothetical protein